MIRINLAPPDSRRRTADVSSAPSTSGSGILLAVVYAVALLGVGGYYMVLSREESRLTQQVTDQQTELATLKATLGASTQVRERLAELQKRVQAIQDLGKNQAASILVLDAFADTIPRDLWITALEERNAEIKASGTAFTANAVADFMSNLKSSGKFKEVDIVVSKQDLTKAPSSPVTFEVTCRYGS